jgi:hypothetical protein
MSRSTERARRPKTSLRAPVVLFPVTLAGKPYNPVYLGCIERLDEQIVCSQVQNLSPQAVVSPAGRHNQQRGVPPAADFGQKILPTAIRQVRFAEDDVGLHLVCFDKSFPAGTGVAGFPVRLSAYPLQVNAIFAQGTYQENYTAALVSELREVRIHLRFSGARAGFGGKAVT